MAAGYVGGLLSQVNHPVEAQEQPVVNEVLRTKRLEIIDNDGKVRGLFEVRRTDFGKIALHEPCLSLLDAAGKDRGTFSTLFGEASLSLLDADSKPRGTFSELAGMARIDLFDRDMTSRGSFLLDGKGHPSLILFDDKAVPRVLLGCNPLNNSGEAQMSSEPKLALFKNDGHIQWQAPFTDDHVFWQLLAIKPLPLVFTGSFSEHLAIVKKNLNTNILNSYQLDIARATYARDTEPLAEITLDGQKYPMTLRQALELKAKIESVGVPKHP